MGVLLVGSTRGAPGATTLALGIALGRSSSPRRTVLVEADPHGGVLAARWRLGYEPGMLSLAAASRRPLDAEVVVRHTQPLGGVPVLCGPPGADAAGHTVRVLTPALDLLVAAEPELDLVVDVGRLGPDRVLPSASHGLVVVRPRLDEVQHLPAAVAAYRRAGIEPAVVCVGARPYAPAEVAAHAGADLAGTVPLDRRSAATLSGDGGSIRLLRRSPLLREAGRLGTLLEQGPDRPPEGDGDRALAGPGAQTGGAS